MKHPVLQAWFDRHNLPWTEFVFKELIDKLGVETIEDLKLLLAEEWEGLFSQEKPIIRRRATAAYESLTKEKFVFTQHLPDISSLEDPTPIKTGSNTSTRSTRGMHENDISRPSFDPEKGTFLFDNFTYERGQSAEAKKAEREERKRKKRFGKS